MNYDPDITKRQLVFRVKVEGEWLEHSAGITCLLKQSRLKTGYRQHDLYDAWMGDTIHYEGAPTFAQTQWRNFRLRPPPRKSLCWAPCVLGHGSIIDMPVAAMGRGNRTERTVDYSSDNDEQYEH